MAAKIPASVLEVLAGKEEAGEPARESTGAAAAQKEAKEVLRD